MARNNEAKGRIMIVPIIVVVSLVVLSFLIIKPFITALLSSAALAYIFYPLHRRLNLRIKSPNISALIIAILILLIVALPLIFLINVASKEVYVSYLLVKQKVIAGKVFASECPEKNFLCNAYDSLKEFFTRDSVRFYLNDWLKRSTDTAVKFTSDFVFAIPKLILGVFVTFFMTFYFLRDGKGIVNRFTDYIEIKETHHRSILKQLGDLTYATLYGSIIVAIIQGVLGGLGFFIFGVPSPILFGGIMILAALIPVVGTAIIWAPAAILLIITGLTTGNMAVLWKGIGLLIYGTVIVSGIDNVLKPKIIGDRAKVHPVLILVGALGGLALFGVIGVLIGPLTLVLLFRILKIVKLGV